MFAVGQVNRVKVVENAGGELFQPGAVCIDFVNVERLFIGWLETEKNALAVIRNVLAARNCRKAASAA